jgi:hypothetical protein
MDTRKRRRRAASTPPPSPRRARSHKRIPSLPPQQKLLLTLEQEDLDWLNTTVAHLKSMRRGSSKSELLRAGLSLLRKKTLDELREILRGLY